MEVCRLCLDLATESDVKKLEGTYKDATQIVLPEVNTDISSSPVICQQCTSSLDELYAFKASVVETEHQIKEKVGDDKCQLHLKEVMTGVKIDKKDADLGKSKDRMCRTCLCAIEGETFTVLKPTQSDAYLNSMLLMCLPEMELELTLDPVMCEQCLSNLQKLYHFKSSCLDVEERLNSYCQQHGTSSRNQINLHSVLEEDAAESKDHNFTAVKSEPIDSSVGDYKSEEDDDVSMSDNSKDLGYTVVKVKKEEQDEDDTEDGDESMGDDAENFTDEEIGELKQEEIKLEDDDEDGAKNAHSQKHQCPSTTCSLTFKTKSEQLQHCVVDHNADKLDCPISKCNVCNYKSTDTNTILKHMLEVHKNDNKFHVCHICGYTNFIQNNVRLHILKEHGDTKNRSLEYRCILCNFRCKTKFWYYGHLRNDHIESIIKCEFCEYLAVSPQQIADHLYSHIDVRNVYKCELCGLRTVTQKKLCDHLMCQHKDSYKHSCNWCDYVTNNGLPFWKHVKKIHQAHFSDLIFSKQEGICCIKCKMKFSTRKQLQAHVVAEDCKKLNANQSEVQLAQSEKTETLTVKKTRFSIFKDPSDAQYKKSRKTHLTKYRCEKCDYKCTFSIAFAEHNLIEHNVKTDKPDLTLLVCKECGLKTYDKQKFDVHEKTHGKTAHKCYICGEKFAFVIPMKEHMLREHKIYTQDMCKLYRCNLCDFRTFDVKVYRNHRNITCKFLIKKNKDHVGKKKSQVQNSKRKSKI